MATTKNPVRLTIMGATGRMGQRLLALGSKDPGVRIAGAVEHPACSLLGSLSADGITAVTGDLKDVLARTDVVVDFTSREAVLPTAKAVVAAKKGLVIGTTGLGDADVAMLKKFAQKIPIVFSPNMSVGMNVLFSLVKEAASALADYDIEIVEAHHNQKKDAPSGTALKLAEIAAEASGRSQKDFVYGREGLAGARTKKEIGVMSLRAGDIVGDHTVLLASTGERLELVHRAHSRDSFVAGALKAAVWLNGRKPGMYSMADVLGLNLPRKG